MTITIPNLCLVVLIGPSGSGKSTFARRHFKPTEIISSDVCRGLISDDENDQSVTPEAFALVHHLAAKRLELGRLTVIDATNVQPENRRTLIELARRFHLFAIAIVFDLPEAVCAERNRGRPDRVFGAHVIRNQRSQMRRGLHGLGREGFREVFTFSAVDRIDAAVVERVPLRVDRRIERGPFDIIGDLHGCADELESLLAQLGYEPRPLEALSAGWGTTSFRHSDGRRAVFVGDLVDRGPRILDTLRIVRNMVVGGDALCVPGNHDDKLLRKLRGRNVRVAAGLERTLAEIEQLPEEVRAPFSRELADFLDGLVSHLVLDGGDLVVAHAGMKREYQGRSSGVVRAFALYGETTGEKDEFGLPVRLPWAADYRGTAAVVYGHTPVPKPEWLNRTVNVDTGCVFGGSLTALRWPEREFVSVPAARVYSEPRHPFLSAEGADRTATLSAQHEIDEVLDADDVLGKRIISTRLMNRVTILEGNATAALEVMSRFAVNPKWLVYLPPTMSPCETSKLPGLLEHPAEAFAHFQAEGVARVIAQEKHMGSRAVLIVCRDESVARARFGVREAEIGVIVTRTGRRFFDNPEVESALLGRVRDALTRADLWTILATDWVCLDAELMPWSAKARELLRSQFAAVGAAGQAALPSALTALTRATDRLPLEERGRAEEVAAALARRAEGVDRFVAAYRQYCWPVTSLADYKLAPFHLLASEGKVHLDRDHRWHMETLATLASADPELLVATRHLVIDLENEAEVTRATRWWTELTENGGEGMVVKPLDFVVEGPRGLVQPAVKCRGRDYLRIIYGPDYDTEENLVRLRRRGLGHKRSLALREFALGIEALERFVRREPLRKVHECVFGVLALESEPVDPRL
jgi:protein phosphatase